MKVNIIYDEIITKELDSVEVCCLEMQYSLNHSLIVFRDGNFYVNLTVNVVDDYDFIGKLLYCPYCGEKIEGIEE